MKRTGKSLSKSKVERLCCTRFSKRFHNVKYSVQNWFCISNCSSIPMLEVVILGKIIEHNFCIFTCLCWVFTAGNKEPSHNSQVPVVHLASGLALLASLSSPSTLSFKQYLLRDVFFWLFIEKAEGVPVIRRIIIINPSAPWSVEEIK